MAEEMPDPMARDMPEMVGAEPPQAMPEASDAVEEAPPPVVAGADAPPPAGQPAVRDAWPRLDAPHAALQCVPRFNAQPAVHALAQQAALEQPRSFTWDGRTAAALSLGWCVQDEHVVELGTAPVPEIGDCLRRPPAAWRIRKSGCRCWRARGAGCGCATAKATAAGSWAG